MKRIQKINHLFQVFSLFILVTQAGCGLGYSNNTDVDANDDDNNEGLTAEDPEANYGKTALGVKNYLQIYESMWAATQLETFTGLPRTDNAFNSIRTYYASNKASLPTDNEITRFSSSQMLAITNLAWEFCDRVVENNLARPAFFSGTSFTDLNNNGLHNPTTLLGSAAQREDLAEFILNRLWGEEVTTTQVRQSAIQELASTILSLSDGAASTSTATRNIVKGVCTAALSSGSVNLF